MNLSAGHGTVAPAFPRCNPRVWSSLSSTLQTKTTFEAERFGPTSPDRSLHRKPADPPAHFVRVLNALTEGLLFERFQSPREITDEVIRSAFEALATSAR
jgi:hypothetical protein